MEKFNKDKNKIKSLKVRKGIPLFINFFIITINENIITFFKD